MTRQMTADEIRAHHGHGIGYRRVRVGRDCKVSYYGSTDAFDRQHDYWHDGGWRKDYWIEDKPGHEDAYQL